MKTFDRTEIDKRREVLVQEMQKKPVDMTKRSSSLLRADQESLFLTEPYLQTPTQKSVSIIWHTKKPAYGWVEYGKTDNFGLKLIW